MEEPIHLDSCTPCRERGPDHVPDHGAEARSRGQGAGRRGPRAAYGGKHASFLRQHQPTTNSHQVKKDLYKLQDLTPDSKDFFPLLDTLLKDLHEHIEHEKSEDMPRLEDKLTREESKSLANYFEKTKLILPTRSHPSAPNKPYFENLAAMLAAPMDKFTDLLRAFPEDGKLGDVLSAGEAPAVVQKS